MQKLILTALDDNDPLWYDNLIPFLLSLRQTDYDGEVGVLDYGLSAAKREVLERHQVQLFTPSHRCSELLLDRHLSAADIAEVHGVAQLAVIDCDIWFPQPHLDLFAQIQSMDKLYCAFDPWRCSFLIRGVVPEAIAEVDAQLDTLQKQQGHMWQVGLILGGQQACANYRDYVLECLTDSRFKLVYGIDSTLFNLYALQHDGVAWLHSKYNCPPVWGIEHKQDRKSVV